MSGGALCWGDLRLAAGCGCGSGGWGGGGAWAWGVGVALVKVSFAGLAVAVVIEPGFAALKGCLGFGLGGVVGAAGGVTATLGERGQCNERNHQGGNKNFHFCATSK